jgi:hypothetical protein
MLLLEILLGHPPSPSLMASITAVFLSLSIGACFGCLVYSLLCANGSDEHPPDVDTTPHPPTGSPK